MNKTEQNCLASHVTQFWTEQAQMAKEASLWANLVAKAAPMASRMSGAVRPALDRGFSAIGRQTMRLPAGNPMSRILAGGSRDVIGSGGEDLAADQLDLGRNVAKRVGVGAGAAYGGALAAEAPGKIQNNNAVAEQNAHPIRSWMEQHLLGRPKLQERSYMNPFA